MSDRYREHRVPTSLARHVGASSTSLHELRELAHRAWHERASVTILPEDFKRLDTVLQAAALAIGATLFGPRRGNKA